MAFFRSVSLSETVPAIAGEGVVLRTPQVEQAKAALAAAQAALARATLNLERTVWRAPFAGRVRSERVATAQFVVAGAPVAELYSVDHAEVRLPLADPAGSTRYYRVMACSNANGCSALSASDAGNRQQIAHCAAGVFTPLDGEFGDRHVGGTEVVEQVEGVRAAAELSPRISVLQIDAHADTRESYQGSTHSHACVMARARELCPIVQVGIRSLDTEEVPNLDRGRVFWAHDIVRDPDDSWVEDVVELLTREVYVTIDLDAFDPSVVPATGTPEPGGLDWYQVTDVLAAVARARRVVGFDLVELLPGHPPSAFLAAKLIYRFLAEIAAAAARGS